MVLQAIRGQQACHLADVPLDGMQPKRAVGDVRDSEVLAAGQDILHADRNHRAERDLEGPAADVEIRSTRRARMQIDPIAADPDGVGE
jgi:hypothetical protein